MDAATVTFVKDGGFEAEARLREMGCPKINLQVRSSNVGVVEFYKNTGYLVHNVVSMGKRLEED